MTDSPRFLKAEAIVDFPKAEEKRSAPSGKRTASSRRASRGAAAHRASSSTTGRRRRTACRTTGTCSRASSRTSFRATRRCAASTSPRKAGWDTHGLPVEVEVEKELGIHGKAEIEAYGVEPFVQRCIESVFRYTKEWERMTEHDGLLGRPPRRLRHLSQGLRRERLVGALASSSRRTSSTKATRSSGGGRRAARRSPRPRSVSATRPSTIRRSSSRSRSSTSPTRRFSSGRRPRGRFPSNMYAAVKPEFDYVVVQDGDPRSWWSRPRCAKHSRAKLGRELPVVREAKGSAFLGKRYRPPFEEYYEKYGGSDSRDASTAHSSPCTGRSSPRTSSTLDAGTGIVHDRAGVRRGTTSRAAPEDRLGLPRSHRGASALRGHARRAIHRRDAAATQGMLGQGRRQGDRRGPQGDAVSSSTPRRTATSTRSAGAPTRIRSSSSRGPPGTSARRR